MVYPPKWWAYLNTMALRAILTAISKYGFLSYLPSPLCRRVATPKQHYGTTKTKRVVRPCQRKHQPAFDPTAQQKTLPYLTATALPKRSKNRPILDPAHRSDCGHLATGWWDWRDEHHARFRYRTHRRDWRAYGGRGNLWRHRLAISHRGDGGVCIGRCAWGAFGVWAWRIVTTL